MCVKFYLIHSNLLFYEALNYLK